MKNNLLGITGIYKITNPINQIYIGQSVNIGKRIYQHIVPSGWGWNTPIYMSIRKYGKKSHKYEIVEICEREKLNELEVYYINKFNTFNTPHGLNKKPGILIKKQP